MVALQLISEERPSVVVSDIGMPEMDGYRSQDCLSVTTVLLSPEAKSRRRDAVLLAIEKKAAQLIGRFPVQSAHISW